MSRKRRHFSTTQGAAIGVAGILLGTLVWQTAAVMPQLGLFLRVLLLFFAWFAFWFFSHDLTHHVVGRLGGVRFQYYFLGRSAIRKLKLPLVSRIMEKIPVMVLRVDKASLASVSPQALKLMHVSGAVSSMFLPWIVVPASYSIGPLWVGVFFTALTLGNDLFTLFFSPKAGDIYRARRIGK